MRLRIPPILAWMCLFLVLAATASRGLGTNGASGLPKKKLEPNMELP